MSEDTAVRVVALRTREDGSPGFVGTSRPVLCWKLDARRDAVLQLAYEIEVAADARFETERASSGRVESERVMNAPWPTADLYSREVRWARVRAWTDTGVTEWSEPLRIEAALLTRDDWTARPVSAIGNFDRLDPAPVQLLRRAFSIDRDVAHARLYVTSLGIHETVLNDVPISDALLEPGWSAYRERLYYSVHDVTNLLERGENVLSAAVGDGWWRGWLTWLGTRAVYGSTTALLAQLEIAFVDGTTMCVGTDADWRGSTGALIAADLYDGCSTDLRLTQPGWRASAFDDSSWEKVGSLELPAGLRLRPMPPVRVVERRDVEMAAGADNVVRIDTGQNLVGYLSLRVRGRAGAAIVVRHAEMLDNDGSLYTAALRAAKATDSYVLSDDAATALIPAFTFHGFRYAEITLDEGVELMSAEAQVIASDLPEIGRFKCSDARVNRLYQNVLWSQRGNFVALPTDCPQRDERLGWTGDIQVFAETACANQDADTFLAAWLEDLAVEQRADGYVTSTVPNVVPGFEYEYGGVGWGDAATLVPWALYEAYGDDEVLARQYPSMRAWVEYGASRLGRDGTWSNDFHLGDWLDPAAPADRPEEATTDRDLIATAYLARSAAVLADTAGVLGRAGEAEHYRSLSAQVAVSAWRRWRDIAPSTQTGAAIALQFGLVPKDERTAVARSLADLVAKNEGRIATGFLGTPLVLPALCGNGEIDAAYRLLMNERCPGWLYQVACGATTMWERWDAVAEDGRLHTGEMAMAEGASMISFNHYAYGAIGAWLYRTVAGLAPDPTAPGYRGIVFAPRPGGGISSAQASIETPYGRAAIEWEACHEVLSVRVEVPPGAEATFVPPPGYDADVAGPLTIGSGTHRIALTVA